MPLPWTIDDLPAYPNWSPHTSDTSSSSSSSPEQPAAYHGESHQSVRGFDRSLYQDTGAPLADSSLRPASMPHTSSTSALRPARSAVQDQQSLEAVRGYRGPLPQASGFAMDDRGFRSRNPNALPNRPSGTVDGAARHRQSPQAPTGVVGPQSGGLPPRRRTAQDFPNFLLNTPIASGSPALRYPRHPRPVGDAGNSMPRAFRTSSGIVDTGRRVLRSQ